MIQHPLGQALTPPSTPWLCRQNHPDGQIFTPPYLLNPDGTLAARPTITDCPATVDPGSTIAVTTSEAAAAFSLIRVCHDVQCVRRFAALGCGRCSVASEPDMGDYMLCAHELRSHFVISLSGLAILLSSRCLLTVLLA